jgi:ubiquinone/menaquinone biosynthesis C-methylase UbiE
VLNDKGNWLKKISERPGEYSLEFGCGSNKKHREFIGVDILDHDEVDIVADVHDVFDELPAAAISSIYTSHFVEHIDDLEAFLGQCARVLVPGGSVDIIVPHFSNPYYFSDPTHKTFFGLYTLCYFAESRLFSRTVPTYGHDLDFSLSSVDLIFTSPKPFYGRYGFKKAVGSVFNSCRYMKEFWEENLCYVVPCYEIHFHLVKKPEEGI